VSRTETTEVVTAHPIRVNRTHFRCDGCGGEIATDAAMEEQYANELYIALNGDECVSMLRRRDYCTVCLEPIWDAINKLIGADTDALTDPAEEWEICR
jgi:hypothetical protein